MGVGTRTYLHVKVRFFHILPLRAYLRRRLTSPATPRTSGREQRGLRMVAIVTGSVERLEKGEWDQQKDNLP